MVSDRRLPRGCTPRWLKLDRDSLGRWGGVTIRLGDPPRIETVAEQIGDHPWRERPPQYRRMIPDKRPWIMTRRGS